MDGNKSKLIEQRTGAGGESSFIAGTRVRVADVVRMIPLVEDDDVIESITRSLPTLSSEQIQAAIDYWLTHKREIDYLIDEEEALFKQHAAAR